MKITDAFWEKRNLGVCSKEITIEHGDKVADVLTLENLDSEYQILKLPVEMASFILPIQSIGFKYIEIQYVCNHNLQTPHLQSQIERMSNYFAAEIANGKDLKLVEDYISMGMFETDRVALDPRFGHKFASKRYIGWINQVLNSGGSIYVLKYKSHAVGFFGIKENDGVCDAFIGGVFPDWNKSGFGIMLNYFEILTARKLGYSELKTSFSSNNPPVYYINRILGYDIRPVCNVFIKHI